MKKEWCIPRVGAEFVWRMEDVLDLYSEPLDPKWPVVCFDERPCQLIDDVLAPVAMKPGRARRAEVIRIVLDNLSSHSPAALYQAFPPEEARRLTRKLEFHYTPKHGSWLNMAEIELSVLARQCLKRRIADKETLQREVAPWQAERNRQQATIQWRFSTTDARTRLNRLYPS